MSYLVSIIERMFPSERRRPDLEHLLDEIAAFGAEDRDGWAPAARLSRVSELMHALNELTGVLTEAVRDADRDHAWASEYANAAHWLAITGNVTRADAVRRVDAARLLADQERTAKAFTAGDISVGALDQLARAHHQREALYAEHEDVLVESATTVAVDQLPKVIKRWAAIHEKTKTNQDLAGTGSRLFVSTTFAGCVKLDGLFEPDDGAILLDAIRQATNPPSDDGRTAAERRADALIGLVTGERRVEPNVDVVIDAHTLHGEPVAPQHARCDVVSIGPVSTRWIEKLLCDCKLGRIITHGPSLPLDVSRQERLVTKAMFRALVIRDGGCRYNGCGRAPRFCDAHHIIAWHNGGETKLDNLILTCRRHHTRVHQDQVHVIRNPDGTIDLRSRPP